MEVEVLLWDPRIQSLAQQVWLGGCQAKANIVISCGTQGSSETLRPQRRHFFEVAKVSAILSLLFHLAPNLMSGWRWDH